MAQLSRAGRRDRVSAGIDADANTDRGRVYFVAPAKYRGDVSTVYAEHLTFDLKTSSVAQFALDVSTAWKIVANIHVKAESDFATAPLATEHDLRTVLGALNTLRIRGEYNDGPDVGALNVHFGV